LTLICAGIPIKGIQPFDDPQNPAKIRQIQIGSVARLAYKKPFSVDQVNTMAFSRLSSSVSYSLEALRNQQKNLLETIGRLLELIKQMLEAEIRDKLFREISCLDSIADVIRQDLILAPFSISKF
jgi:hypothetical protein